MEVVEELEEAALEAPVLRAVMEVRGREDTFMFRTSEIHQIMAE